MNTLIIVLGIFFGLSFLSSIVVLSACALSSETSQELEPYEPAHYTSYENRERHEPALVKEIIITK